jgi:hypothetical protein
MRVTWPDRFTIWTDSVGSDVRPLWLSEGGRAALRDFIAGFAMDEIDFAYVPLGGTREAYRLLGVLGTPTLYLVDREGIVRAGFLGDAFPPVDLSRSVCRG